MDAFSLLKNKNIYVLKLSEINSMDNKKHIFLICASNFFMDRCKEKSLENCNV